MSTVNYNFNKFIDKLINLKSTNSIEAKKHTRWIYHKKTLSYIVKSTKPNQAIVKIESVLSRLNADLKKYVSSELDKKTYENTEILIRLIQQKVISYKSRHGKIYLFFSKIFFGNIDKISNKVSHRLENIRSSYHPMVNLNKINQFNKSSDIILKDKPQNYMPQIDFAHELIEDVSKDKLMIEPDQTPEEFDADQSGDDIENIPLIHSVSPQTIEIPPSYNPSNEELLETPNHVPDLFNVAEAKAHPQKLENLLKTYRLKFFDLFSQKIQMPEPDQPLRLPLIEITENYMAIRFSKEQKVQGFDAWLQEKCQNKNIPFRPKSLEMKQIIGSKERIIPKNYEGIPCVREINFSFEEALKLIEDIPERGVANLSKLVGHDLNVHHYHYQSAQIAGNAPSIENTIALTLAHLDPKFHLLIAKLQSVSDPQKDYPIPLIEFNPHGMTIKISDSDKMLKDLIVSPELKNKDLSIEDLKEIIRSEENLKNLIKQIFGFKGDVIEETHFERSYSYEFRIEGEEVKTFFKQLGIDKIPPEGLHEKYRDFSYLQILQTYGIYHAYEPVLTDDALESISKSLPLLVSNERNVQPFVTYHPRGWLSIKLPKGSDDYSKRLAEHLKSEWISIQQDFNNENYQYEIDIYEEELPKFLKTLGLDYTSEGIPFLDQMREYLFPKSLNTYSLEDKNKKLNLPHMIAKMISALDPEIKEEFKKAKDEDYPVEGVPVIDVTFAFNRIDIKIPAKLNEKKVKMGPHQNITFGEYFSQVYALEGKVIEELDHHELKNFYLVNVPPHRVKGFFEKDLSLRKLPKIYKTVEYETFFSYFQNLQPYFKPITSTVDLTLRNPSLPMPQVPEISRHQIMQTVKSTLAKSFNKETFVKVFENILEDTEHGSFRYRYKEGENAEDLDSILAYLKLIIHELMTNENISSERKSEAIIEIANGCRNSCVNGQLTKIQNVFQKLVHPEFADIVRGVLLDKIEIFKDEVLKSVFKHMRNSIAVHVINAARVFWGDIFGLNQEIGKQDKDYIQYKYYFNGYVADPQKKEFKDFCEENLLNAIYNLIKDDKDDRGTILNSAEFQMRLRKILRKEGLKPTEIDTEMERLMPNEINLQKILQDEGLNPEEIRIEMMQTFLSEEIIFKNLKVMQLRKLLQKEGLNYNEILERFALWEDDQALLSKFMLDHKVNERDIRLESRELYKNNFTMTKEAVAMLLTDVGVLIP